MNFDTFEKQVGPQKALEIRKALRAGGLPELLSWLYRQDFRSPHSAYREVPGANPGMAALEREGQATGSRKVLDFLASVIGEEVVLPTTTFRQVKEPR